MKAITLRAHFDGEQIRLDDPFQIQPDSPLTVTVWPQEREEEEEEALALLSGSLLADVPADEPEYSLDLIKEPNPDYEGVERSANRLSHPTWFSGRRSAQANRRGDWRDLSRALQTSGQNPV